MNRRVFQKKGMDRPGSSPGRLVMLVVVVALLVRGTAPNRAMAQTTQAAVPEVAIQVVTEDQIRQIRATVTLAGKPLKDITVAFFIARTFGNMDSGQDKTEEDGTAQVPFPTGLPGGRTGLLHAIAIIQAPAQYSRVRGQADLPGGTIIPPESQAFPRALWAPRAPLLLIAAIALILVSVWGCYAYVAVQILAILRRT